MNGSSLSLCFRVGRRVGLFQVAVHFRGGPFQRPVQALDDLVDRILGGQRAASDPFQDGVQRRFFLGAGAPLGLQDVKNAGHWVCLLRDRR
jgi:hypothetical protein